MYKIIIKNIHDYNSTKIKEFILESLFFTGKKIEGKKRYLIKPNLLKPASPNSAITTHPIIIRVVIELVKEFGAYPFIGDSPGLGSLERVLKRLDLLDFLRFTDTKVVDFSKTRTIKNEKNLLYKELRLPEILFNVDEIINIPKLKTHQMMVLTLAVKNLYGLIHGTEKIKYHFLADKDYSKFAKLLLDIYTNVKPQINILDGILGMEGNGPSSGDIKKFNIIAVSNNALSLDYVIANLFNLDIHKIPHLATAYSENFHELKDSFIEISDLLIEKNYKIKLPRSHKLNFSMPDFVTKFIKNFVISYPYINKKLCKKCKVCTNTCPALAIKENFKIDKKRCIRCYCCQELCEKNAILIKRSIFNVWR